MLGTALLAGALCSAAVNDLQRARSKVPRDAYRNPVFNHMGKQLNGHLTRGHPNTKPCHEWTPEKLQQLQATLFAHREPAHDHIYAAADDARALRRHSVAAHKAHWGEVGRTAGEHPLLKEMQRDGHCHEAVMWWVHHLSHEKRQELRDLLIPTLPIVEWREPIAAEGAAAAKVYNTHYHPSSTCLACHGGGMPWQIPDTEPAPLPRQVNGNDRKRRCDEWYGKEEGGVCGPCEGIGGWYWGNMPDEGTFFDCEVVAQAKDIPKSDRAPSAFPKAFAVEMRGADRWPRASASSNKSCEYVSDCTPLETENPGYPTTHSHWYAQLHGVLYLDHNLGGQFAGGRLRHESVYEMPNGKEGEARSAAGMFGLNNIHLTEIHLQSGEQAKADNPGIMLNLNHYPMSVANASGTDDSKLDWRRIPATDGACACIPDPAGMPSFMTAFDNGTYVGRIKMSGNLHQMLNSGGPDNGKQAIIADVWMKWTFHLYVDTASGFPVAFASPYGGFATYGNWTVPKPDILWPEWRENPTQGCVNPMNSPDCLPYTPPPVPQV